MLEFIRRYHFAAAHRLHNPALSDEENRELYMACNNPNGHGHNYVIEFSISGTPDPVTNMLIDMVALDTLVQTHIIDVVDHKHLDLDVAWFADTRSTAENIAMIFYNQLAPLLPANAHLVQVIVWEGENNAAAYRPNTPTLPLAASLA
ncbi:MAG: 6-carboxytetrahydropterin synthase [Vampirovibrionales bacterium]